MTVLEIAAAADRLRKKYKTSEPEPLIAAMGILLQEDEYSAGLKGFFVEHCRVRLIAVNSALPPELRRLVLAHELGHAVLHRRAEHPFRESELFGRAHPLEREANLFAAQLLLPSDEAVLNPLREGESFFTVAASLGVPPELLEYKLAVLRARGEPVPAAPVAPRSDFLRSVGG